MKDSAIKTVKFYDAVITLTPESGGVSWLAQLPPPPEYPDDENHFSDGIVYGTFFHAVMAARLHLKRFAVIFAIQEWLDELYERRDGTIPENSQYQRISESLQEIAFELS